MPSICVHPARQSASSDLIALLKHVETATIGHFRETGFFDPAIAAICGNARIAGTAVTVLAPGDDGTAICLAVDSLRSGDVLVVDRCGDRKHACWGNVLAHAAKTHGAVGIVVDGFVTDRAALVENGPPVWARGVSPITTKLRRTSGGVNIPVSCGGVAVSPGDIILADENGVLALTPDAAEDTAKRALAIQSAEPNTIARLSAGDSLSAIHGLSDITDTPT